MSKKYSRCSSDTQISSAEECGSALKNYFNSNSIVEPTVQPNEYRPSGCWFSVNDDGNVIPYFNTKATKKPLYECDGYGYKCLCRVLDVQYKTFTNGCEYGWQSVTSGEECQTATGVTIAYDNGQASQPCYTCGGIHAAPRRGGDCPLRDGAWVSEDWVCKRAVPLDSTDDGSQCEVCGPGKYVTTYFKSADQAAEEVDDHIWNGYGLQISPTGVRQTYPTRPNIIPFGVDTFWGNDDMGSPYFPDSWLSTPGWAWKWNLNTYYAYALHYNGQMFNWEYTFDGFPTGEKYKFGPSCENCYSEDGEYKIKDVPATTRATGFPTDETSIFSAKGTAPHPHSYFPTQLGHIYVLRYANDDYQCLVCPQGFEVDKYVVVTDGLPGATTCTECPPGKYRTRTEQHCTACPDGKTSIAGTSSCFPIVNNAADIIVSMSKTGETRDKACGTGNYPSDKDKCEIALKNSGFEMFYDNYGVTEVTGDKYNNGVTGCSVDVDGKGFWRPPYLSQYQGRNPLKCNDPNSMGCVCTVSLGERNKFTADATTSGSSGGECTCPDGSIYWVGDKNDNCGSLNCEGGSSGHCNRYPNPLWSHNQVICEFNKNCGSQCVKESYCRHTINLQNPISLDNCSTCFPSYPTGDTRENCQKCQQLCGSSLDGTSFSYPDGTSFSGWYVPGGSGTNNWDNVNERNLHYVDTWSPGAECAWGSVNTNTLAGNNGIEFKGYQSQSEKQFACNYQPATPVSPTYINIDLMAQGVTSCETYYSHSSGSNAHAAGINECKLITSYTYADEMSDSNYFAGCIIIDGMAYFNTLQVDWNNGWGQRICVDGLGVQTQQAVCRGETTEICWQKLFFEPVLLETPPEDNTDSLNCFPNC